MLISQTNTKPTPKPTPKHFIMCLTVRRNSCFACVGIATAWRYMDELEDDMADGKFTEQEYIGWMALFKETFEVGNKSHKEKGCCDHHTEEELAVLRHNDEEDEAGGGGEMRVVKFFHRGYYYLMEQTAAPGEDGRRSLFSVSTDEEVGYVSSVGAVNFFTTDTPFRL